MQLQSLSGRKTCDRVLRKGKVWKGRTLVVRYLPGPPVRKGAATSNDDSPALYVGTLASKKLHKSAVKRNRMRRRVREALRVQVRDQEDLPTTQLLLQPRSASLDVPFEEILEDTSRFLQHLSP